jgi:5-methylcytosine-specific restriction protein B
VPFAQSGDEPYVHTYELPLEAVRPLPEELRQAYEVTLDYIAWKFGHWKRSPYWKQHKPEVMEALFSAEKRDQLFAQGLPELPPALREAPEPYVWQDRSIEYSLAQCARDTGLDEALLARWVQAIERKGQAILYGPPGTGKTFVAERLAEHMTGGGDGFWELVQFHPAYTYEDFVQGLRPRTRPEGGLDYPLVPGRFLEFCETARTCQDRCVLIIDEINRANLSQVFGELMYLLEYRDREIQLAGGTAFRVPANVRLIGTMNTADRSVALVDHALRRRFAFLALYPDYDVLRRFHANTGFPVAGLINTLQRLNRQIGDPHYEVGITFFLRWNLAEQLEDIWRMEIEPYLEEYFFDQPEKVAAFRWDVIKEQLRA